MHRRQRSLRLGIGGLAFLLFAAGGVGCAPATGLPGSETGAIAPVNGVLTIKASEMKFQPSVLEVPAGKSVKLVLENVGVLEHELEIEGLAEPSKAQGPQQVALRPAEEPGASDGHGKATETHKDDHGEAKAADHAKEGTLHLHAEGGEKATMEFVAPSEPGRYTFACNIPGHREAGMVGTLIVH